MKWFKNQKSPNLNSLDKIDLNDDLYLDDEMKTFNPTENELELDSTIKVESINKTEFEDQKFKARNGIKPDFIPESYNDLQKAAWMLIHGRRVVVSLVKLNKSERSKTLNFFAGILYTLNGQKTRLEKDLYLFTVEKNNNLTSTD